MKYLKKYYNENIDWDWIDEEESGIPDNFKDYEDFYKFLIDNDTLDKYLKNRKGLMINDDIQSAFIWNTTIEGWNYWNDLRKKWYKKRKEK